MEFIKNSHLYGDTFFFPGNKIGFLLIHGYTATTAEVRLLGEKLHQDGFTVSAPLLPGHQTTPDDLNKCSWKDWYAAVKTSYSHLRQRVDTVFVAGESLGALLTLLLAREKQDITGLLCYSPALIIPKVWLSRVAFPFVKYLPKEKREDGLAWKGYTVNPIHAIAQVNIIQNRLHRELPRINTPISIFQSEIDNSIDPKGATKIYEKIGSKDKEIHWFNESSHCMILDKQLDEIYAVTHKFVTRLI